MANIGGKKLNIFRRMGRYLRECWMELLKTSWPSKEELRKSTTLVLVAIIVMAVWMGGLDALLAYVSNSLGL